MALKAYKHLTDGEVKIVASGSAEETSLLADTVTGSSYLQLTSTGHSQEVAAAQGTALWVDVTSDLGGGLPTGMDYQVFEVTNLTIPAGTDWSDTPHAFDPVTLPVGRGAIILSLDLELAAVPSPDLVDFAINVEDPEVSISIVGSILVGSDNPTTQRLSEPRYAAAGVYPRGVELLSSTATSFVPIVWAANADFDGPTTADITIVRARASFLVI
jgi:hypothetical protein